MPLSRCVVQDCDNETDLDAVISIHLSPLSDHGRLQWKKFLGMHRKHFNPLGQFGICSLHFTKNCFTRTLYIPGTSRRFKPGAIPTTWKEKATSPVSSRSRRRVSMNSNFCHLQSQTCQCRTDYKKNFLILYCQQTVFLCLFVCLFFFNSKSAYFTLIG